MYLSILSIDQHHTRCFTWSPTVRKHEFCVEITHFDASVMFHNYSLALSAGVTSRASWTKVMISIICAFCARTDSWRWVLVMIRSSMLKTLLTQQTGEITVSWYCLPVQQQHVRLCVCLQQLFVHWEPVWDRLFSLVWSLSLSLFSASSSPPSCSLQSPETFSTRRSSTPVLSTRTPQRFPGDQSSQSSLGRIS